MMLAIDKSVIVFLRSLMMESPSKHDLTRGAVAFLDILGFENLQAQGFTASNILDRMECLAGRAHKQLSKLQARGFVKEGFRPVLELVFVADSVLLFSHCEQSQSEQGRDEIASCLELVLLAASSISANAAASSSHDSTDRSTKKPRFCFRGAIAVGDFALRRVHLGNSEQSTQATLWTGDAVFESARCERKAQAGIIWLTPNAREHVGNLTEETRRLLMEHAVPLKDGSHLNTYAVVPSTMCRNYVSEGVRDQILSTFKVDGRFASLDVAIKHDNTRAFLQKVVDSKCS